MYRDRKQIRVTKGQGEAGVKVIAEEFRDSIWGSEKFWKQKMAMVVCNTENVMPQIHILKMIKMTNFMLYIFYHSQKGKHQNIKERKRQRWKQRMREKEKMEENALRQREQRSAMVTTGLLTRRGEQTFLDFYRFGHKKFSRYGPQIQTVLPGERSESKVLHC